MPRRPVLVLCFALTAASFAALPAALAQEGQDPAANPQAPQADPVRAAWDAFKAAQSEAQAAAKSKDRATGEAAGAGARAARKEFVERFAKSDWNAWDPAKDEQMLTMGLLFTCNDAMTAGDGKTAVRACETLLAKFPGSQRAGMVTAHMLPAAHLKSGDLAKAVAVWEKGSQDADAGTKAASLVALGDVKSAQGDVEGALGAWKQVAGIASPGGQRDPVARSKSDAEMRLALVGQPAPEIDSKVWLGGEPKALSAHKGQVVVIDFWATWCAPCRAVMPGLNEMFEKRKGEGLSVLGVTRVYTDRPGFLPKPATKEPVSDGENVPGLTEETYPAHLEAFRKNLAITYPFVTATQAEFQAYRVSGIPTMAVVGRDGKVAFVKVGGGDDTLLGIAVSKALGSPVK